MRIGRSHQAASLAALLVAGALGAGCGGSDDNSTTATLSPSEYVAKATAICKPANQRIEAAAHKYLGSGGASTALEFEHFASASVIPETQNVIDAFKGLAPPADQAQAFHVLLAELQSVNDRLKASPQALAQQDDPFAKANQLAKQAGLDACSSD